MEKVWRSFPCNLSQLNLDIVLSCGQCFRWQKTDQAEWIGVADKVLWIFKQNEHSIQYRSLNNLVLNEGLKSSATGPREEQAKQTDREAECLKSITRQNSEELEATKLTEEELFLKDYFQMDVDLPSFYKTWSDADQIFKNLAGNFQGLRILRQDPVENLFSFICSQNNHISRISSMVEKLCTAYGQPIAQYEGKTYYAFPTVAKLAGPKVDEKLRKLGFGYRAKFVSQTAKHIVKHHSDEWLFSLRKVSHEEAHKELVALPGVGPKVADCICLMSLDKTEAVPVDTHVWQVAARDYLPHLKSYKSVTDKAYKEIGDYFRELYGPYTGWATSVLFSADLRRFKELKKGTSPAKNKEEKQKKAPKRKVSSASLTKASKVHADKKSWKCV